MTGVAVALTVLGLAFPACVTVIALYALRGTKPGERAAILRATANLASAMSTGRAGRNPVWGADRIGCATAAGDPTSYEVHPAMASTADAGFRVHGDSHGGVGGGADR